MKYITMTGGVLSSLGKGITSASIALLLEKRGLKVALLKLDPYLNVDPGTMNPFQHGEVYVTDDGAETDLDLGHYYRFCNSPLSKASNATSGQIYDTVIKRERQGDYLGNTVQVVPHVTDEIKRRIEACGSQEAGIDVIIIEIGGTVGDIESQPFLEAVRQFRYERPKDCIHIHLTYVPYIRAAGEVKTKPTQHSVQMLREIGIVPDMILCRCEEPLSDEVKAKISLFCSVPRALVIDVPDVDNTIYEVPLNLQEQGLDERISELLSLPKRDHDLHSWKEMVHAILNPKGKVVIGVAGKYVRHKDAYKSVFEALIHGGIANGVEVEIRGIETDALTTIPEDIDGFLVPGGFGERGFEGKVSVAKHCREKNIPYFGICYGMHVMAVEFARNVLGLKAHTTEVDPATPAPIISLLTEQKEVKMLGGTMRLGAYDCALSLHSKVHAAYQNPTISERHRHRYEFNNTFRKQCEDEGIIISGINPTQNLVEIIELKDHPWMVGVQYHPELKSKPTSPHPLFRDFIKAVVKQRG